MFDAAFGQMGGKEYFSDAFTTHLPKEGIRREFTCRHTPQQNGVVKRKNWHILEVARAMMNEKNVPKSYLAEATCMTERIGTYLR